MTTTETDEGAAQKAEPQAMQATRAELAAGARRHYEEISGKACDWLSTIPHAIDAWEKLPELEASITRLQSDLAAAREEANTAARAAQHVAENLTRVMKERDCERIRVQGCYEAIALALDKMDAKDPAAYILSDAQLIPETFVAQLIEEREENARLRSRLQRTPAAVAEAVRAEYERRITEELELHKGCVLFGPQQWADLIAGVLRAVALDLAAIAEGVKEK